MTGIKAFAQPEGARSSGGPDSVLLECSFVWDSRMEVKLLVTLLGQRRANATLRSLLSNVSRVKVCSGRSVRVVGRGGTAQALAGLRAAAAPRTDQPTNARCPRRDRLA